MLRRRDRLLFCLHLVRSCPMIRPSWIPLEVVPPATPYGGSFKRNLFSFLSSWDKFLYCDVELNTIEKHLSVMRLVFWAQRKEARGMSIYTIFGGGLTPPWKDEAVHQEERMPGVERAENRGEGFTGCSWWGATCRLIVPDGIVVTFFLFFLLLSLAAITSIYLFLFWKGKKGINWMRFTVFELDFQLQFHYYKLNVKCLMTTPLSIASSLLFSNC